MSVKIDIVFIFDELEKCICPKEITTKKELFVSFTKIICDIVPTEIYEEKWKSEKKNDDKMDSSFADKVLNRKEQFPSKYGRVLTLLKIEPHDIALDIQDLITCFIEDEFSIKYFKSIVVNEKSISDKERKKLLAQSDISLFLAALFIYGAKFGYQVKKNSSKETKSQIKKETNGSFRKTNYLVSVDTKPISDSQVNIPDDLQKNEENNSQTLVFLPEREKDNLFDKNNGYLNRPTYTIQEPANHITFNSITNNKSYGDERNFTVAKLVSERSDTWRNSIHVTADDEYIVKIYVHNNAAENLKLVAENTRVAASIPNTTGTKIKIQGQLKADNSIPKNIWNSVIFKSDKRFNIIFVQGSARYYNNINPSTGFNLSDDIATSKGALLGYEQMDGKVPGCNQYSGIVTFKVKAQVQKQANFTLNKQVRKFGEKNWQKSITALPNETLEYLISYSNTGEIPMKDIVVKDVLSGGMKYIDGSAKIANSFNPSGVAITSDEIVGKGINIGNYEMGANAFVTYSAKILESKEFAQVPSSLMSKTQVFTKYGSKSDTVNIEVNLGKDTSNITRIDF